MFTQFTIVSGMVPEKLLAPTKKTFKLVISPIDSGRVPVKEFEYRLTSFILLRLPIVLGSGPKSPKEPRSKCVSSVNLLPMLSGIVPVIELPKRSTYSREVKRLRSSDRVPESCRARKSKR